MPILYLLGRTGTFLKYLIYIAGNDIMCCVSLWYSYDAPEIIP